MRILTVGNRYPPWSVGGYEITWAATVERLRAGGNEVRVLTTRPDDGTDHVDSEQIGVHRELDWYWQADRFPKQTLRQTLSLERHNLRTLARHLDELAPHVVMWWGMGGMSLSLIEDVRRRRIPALGMVGDDWMSYGPRVDRWTGRWRGVRRGLAPLAERVARVPARPRLEVAARWAFNSSFTLAAARASGVEPRSATVIHPGVDATRFVERPLAPWRWRLLCCGRLDPRKGVDVAIQALRHLPEEATLTIVGSGGPEHVEELRHLVEALGLQSRVSFSAMSHDAVPEAYINADVLVFPVRWQEPWGLVPLEAMSVGRPVIASRAGGGPAEYLREEENCLGFTVDDATGLANAVLRLAAEPALVKRVTQGGRLTAARFSEQRFLLGVERELEQLVAPL